MGTTATSVLARLNQHRAWVNQNLLTAAASLSPEQLLRTFAIGQGSIWKSLLHMYAAEYVWLEALLGNDDACCPGDVRGKLPGNQLGEGAIPSLDELREKWTAQERRWADYVSSLQDAALDEPVYRVSRSVGAETRITVRRSDAILHACLHAHYTAAQVVNVFRQLGAEPFPPTMVLHLVWQEAAREA